jgi:hypothetical protein
MKILDLFCALAAFQAAAARAETFLQNSHTDSTNSNSTQLVWPFHHGTNASLTNSTACSTFSTCTSCSDESFCHWCDKDQHCHAMGSIHGCVSGSSCAPPRPAPVIRNDTCMHHDTCSECALSSVLCHWCAHDQTCHTVGSIYGCASGVDCYSNDRCKRNVSEPFEHVVFTRIPFGVLLFFVAGALVGACCLSACFCVAVGVKGAYEELADVSVMARNNERPRGRGNTTVVLVSEDVPIGSSPLVNQNASSEEEIGDDLYGGREYVRLVEGSIHGDEEGGGIVSSSSRRPMRYITWLGRACTLCYVMSLLIIAACTVACIRYYPKRPEYNVCNDSVAWKSLISSLTNMKVTADFEILASVSNPNHLDVALDMGKGSFTHNGAFVGTFDIPPSVITSMSITDIFLIAHLSPDKWAALGLATEYARGTLVLDVDTQATIRVPAMANYSFTSELKNIEVRVNEMSDRHLCACPEWSQKAQELEWIPSFIGES